MAKIKLVGAIVDNDSAKIYGWWGFDAISARQVEKAINGLEDGEELDIDLNSPGGYCSVGAEIYTMLRQCSKDGHSVTVNVVGEACSAATVLMCGADTVNGSDVAMFMFHNSSTSVSGKARDMRSAKECLEQTDENIVNAYALKTGKSREELHDLIDAETWMSVDRAIEYGFVDGLMFEEEEDNPDNPDDNLDGSNQLIMNSMHNRIASNMQRIVADADPLIPEDKLELMRNVMIQETAKSSGIDEPNGIPKVNDVNNSNNGVGHIKPINSKGGAKKMTLNEAYEEHPELRAEVEQQVKDATTTAVTNAVSAERTRIQDIEAIADSVPEDMVKDAKFENPVDAKDLAFNAMKANRIAAANYMKDAVNDSNESGAADVPSNAEGDTPEASNDDAVADELAGYVNNRKGGRK